MRSGTERSQVPESRSLDKDRTFHGAQMYKRIIISS